MNIFSHLPTNKENLIERYLKFQSNMKVDLTYIKLCMPVKTSTDIRDRLCLHYKFCRDFIYAEDIFGKFIGPMESQDQICQSWSATADLNRQRFVITV